MTFIAQDYGTVRAGMAESAQDGIAQHGVVLQLQKQTNTAQECMTARYGTEMPAAAGTALHILLQQRHLMNTALETGIAEYGMETIAAVGIAQPFLQAQQQDMTNTAQNGTAACGILEKKCA